MLIKKIKKNNKEPPLGKQLKFNCHFNSEKENYLQLFLLTKSKKGFSLINPVAAKSLKSKNCISLSNSI